MSTLKPVTDSQTALIAYYTSVKGKCAYDPSHSSEEKTLLKCSVCKTAFYCGVSCQSIDWPKHKHVCAILMKESSPASNPPTQIAPNPTLSFLDQIAEDLKRIAIQTIQEIARQNQTRIQGYPEDPRLLMKGVYTPLQYYKAHLALEPRGCLGYLRSDYEIPLNSRSGYLFNGHLPAHAFVRLYRPIERLEDPMNRERFGFIAKGSLSPTSALDALLEGPSLLESITACQAAYWKAIQGVLRDKFDPLFNGVRNNGLIFRMESPDKKVSLRSMNPLNGLITTTLAPSHKAQPGQILYFSNVFVYASEDHFFDDGAGYAAICTGEKEGVPLFTTLQLSAEGEGSEEVDQRLFDRFKEKPLQGFIGEHSTWMHFFRRNDPRFDLSPYEICLISNQTLKELDEVLKFNAEIKSISNSFEEFKKRGGGKMSPVVREFNVERIALLASIDNPQGAEALLARWKQEKQEHVLF